MGPVLYSAFGDHSLLNFSKSQEVGFIRHFTDGIAEAQADGVFYPILHIAGVRFKLRSVCIQHPLLDHPDK